MAATFESSRVRGATGAPLTAKQRERLRALLLAERAALTRQLDEHARVLADAGEHGTALGGTERELVVLHAARAGELVEEVDEALNRLGDGSYGACELCGRAIPFERLEAIPRARVCVACPPPGVLRR
jgi:DnaK suppressor protein